MRSLLSVGFLATFTILLHPLVGSAEYRRPIHVVDFLPGDHVEDGTVSYQKHLQRAIDALPDRGGEIVFAPMVYLIDNPRGLTIRSNCSLRLQGAQFIFGEECDSDGQLFYGENIENLTVSGGSIVGHNGSWSTGVNIRGIHLRGASRNIRIQNMEIRDLSSNGIGIFAADEQHPATDVWIKDTIIDNCCNFYGDYQAPPPTRRGPEKGSTREDQGLVALYHVHDFVVRGCRMENSRSDGTHFYFCRNGHISDNRIARAQMGGYFLESCQHVLAVNNVIRDNGSRGVTIERGSQFCTLTGNTIQGSGREGLWIPDSLRCVVTGNAFSLNGRKENGEERHLIWNANITINEARGDKLDTPTAHYLIADNIIETDSHQIAAIRIDTEPELSNIVIRGNLLIGENTKILVEGPRTDAVVIQENVSAAR
ncbi:right-handed parallel beta-helix repeat-containing protein [Rubinisphaera margarita]|uniref:right-handed parallel beta-helix repeat-containing protein n=1 Tax=Rubinisphaera margarita TaxID=2909586 RepID=UPI001EE8BDBE|nr:right-handed parallel beta-helix repeat-containing protein [Rubinisphaera margarita]MCG6156592.1 right-handed parallel beta-helix repeat-containing protein [Rubinisphaera margarita]